jgi:hypothetical protein
MQELPLSSEIKNYTVRTELDGLAIVLDVRWNDADKSWYFDVLAEDGTTVLAQQIRVVLGVYLGRHKWVAPFTTGVLVAYDLSGKRIDAGIDDLGSRVVVRYFTNAEVAQIRSGALDAASPIQ